MAKHKQVILAGFFLTVFYLATRLINLTLLPIFTDEAIYIRWSQIALQDPAHRFISLYDGKQPLFVWLNMLVLNLPVDPLIAGRLVSVAAGLASLMGITALAWRLFGQKTAFFTGLLYIISPFFLFYDRLALYDSLTNTFMISALLLQVLLVQTLRLDTTLLLGFAIGGGLLTKSSANFAIYLLPASLFLFDWHRPGRWRRIGTWVGLSLVAILIAFLFEVIMKLSPYQHMVGLKTARFIVPIKEFFQADAWARFHGNLGGLTNWLIAYFTWPWLIGVGVTLLMTLRLHWRKTLLLFGWFIGPYLVLTAFGLILYPRFILFMTFPLLIILAFGLGQLAKRVKSYWLLAIGYTLVAGYALYFSFRLLTNPILAPLPGADYSQFIADWPAGYGINEVVEFLRQETRDKKVFVATEGTFGLTPYALEIYLQDNPNIKMQGFWPINDHPEEIFNKVGQFDEVYILFKDSQNPPERFPDRDLELVSQYRKGQGNIFMKLYRVKQ
jgi:4-amino-4-deoxy-L-arabinose transferase-like glycosyltransferase